jgi:hypothetical protein
MHIKKNCTCSCKRGKNTIEEAPNLNAKSINPAPMKFISPSKKKRYSKDIAENLVIQGAVSNIFKFSLKQRANKDTPLS